MNRLAIILGTFIGVGATLAAGLMHGQLTQRWGDPDELIQAGARVESLPSQCGEWTAEQTMDLEDHVIRMLECAGYVQRVYHNQRTGDFVRLVVLVGPPGPMSAHTPEICYSSQSFSILSSREERVVFPENGQEARLWALPLASRDASAARSVVYYAWNDGRGWQAANSPRLEFAGQPLLYKIQLSSAAPAAGESDDACARFLQDFLPVADRTLFFK